MVIGEILELTGASKPSIYRWMDRHPTLVKADPETLVGHSFPKPVRKEGRIVHWDDSEVLNWWKENGSLVGRHPEDGPTVTMPWSSYRLAMLIEPKVIRLEDGEEEVQDHMDMVQSAERRGDEVKLTFRNVSDAVLFKLTYS